MEFLFIPHIFVRALAVFEGGRAKAIKLNKLNLVKRERVLYIRQ